MTDKELQRLDDLLEKLKGEIPAGTDTWAMIHEVQALVAERRPVYE